MLRCVGVGECRRTSGGTMCPSYRVTKEEKDSTRGRARMLFEMQMGDVAHGWRDQHVRESLDLCLSCKGCKGDCPVNVDMATYKAEFLSHYYKGRIRRPSAFAFGWIDRWSRLASAMPAVANFLTQSGLTAPLMKAIAGIAPQRKLPAFARRTFRDWWKKEHITRDGSRGKVILWPDTFNNYFLPRTLIAGVLALEACGFEVVIPSTHLCCGRPLYDYGMLVRAKRLLHTILSALRDDIRQGIPVVGLEPSCVAVFRDELCNLFPADMDAMRLKTQTFTLAELLEKKAADLVIPTLHSGALLHGHCHHKAIMTMSADERLMKRIGLDYELLDAGCCGMAGSFGYEKGQRYEVSVGAGELSLLPRVRSTKEDTLIIADGFSCREQIRQLTGRKALHTAEVLAKAWGVGGMA